MALKVQNGDKFPDEKLIDDSGHEVSIGDFSGGQPLVLSFYRGPW